MATVPGTSIPVRQSFPSGIVRFSLRDFAAPVCCFWASYGADCRTTSRTGGGIDSTLARRGPGSCNPCSSSGYFSRRSGSSAGARCALSRRITDASAGGFSGFARGAGCGQLAARKQIPRRIQAGRGREESWIRRSHDGAASFSRCRRHDVHPVGLDEASRCALSRPIRRRCSPRCKDYAPRQSSMEASRRLRNSKWSRKPITANRSS